MDFLGPIMEILPTLWNCTSSRTAVICHLQENLTSLRQKRLELENIKQRCQEQVELEEQQYRKRTNQVEGWLESVQLKLEGVQKVLLKGEREIQKKCLGSCCPRNCYSSYKLGKEQCVKEDVLNSHPEIPELAKSTLPKSAKVGDYDDYVKMHDVLRDMALWLASVKDNKIVVYENQESIKKHGIATWKEATSVTTFPSSWFQSMQGMKVLDLSKNLLLTRLPAMLEMINLQYLNLSDTSIQELPIVAGSLTKLRFLLLDGTTYLKAISGGVISSLSSLQVFSRVPTKNSLLFFHSFWNTTLLQELEGLEDIEEISVTFFTVNAVFKLKSSPKLQSRVKRLVILCEEEEEEEEEELHSPKTPSSVLSYSRLDNLHDLYIKKCGGAEEEEEEEEEELHSPNTPSSVLSYSRFDNLHDLYIKKCEKEELHSPNISSSVLSSGRFDNLHDLYIKKCLVKDLACLRYAAMLRFVFAVDCPLLEEIIPYEFGSSSEDSNMFKNLKQLNFCNLPRLKSICRVMHFPSLERIWVINCQSLTKLPLDVVNENNSTLTVLGRQEWWDKLEWENLSSKVSYSSMHQTQTAPISGLAAQSCSDNFPRFIVDDWWSDGPSYTYEGTKFEERM
ncbi:hypothetical protein Patl1_34409 [Pistacia atlantica]|uniref:Uncharacterized protein n=1 Tax=Pistacia atlantica TaxID=434234 RepID=A0ACC0ZSR4_9ROSI|nr:hypothetical protein Patl1_34409 [Pistacia atlantica]